MRRVATSLLLFLPMLAMADPMTDRADTEAIADGLATGEIKAACNAAQAKITLDMPRDAWRACYDRVKVRYFEAVRKQTSDYKSCEVAAIHDSDEAAIAPLKMSVSPGWTGDFVRFEGTVISFDRDGGLVLVENGSYTVQVHIPRSAVLVRYDTIVVGKHAYGYGRSNGSVRVYTALGQPMTIQEIGAYCLEGPPLPTKPGGVARRLFIYDPPQ